MVILAAAEPTARAWYVEGLSTNYYKNVADISECGAVETVAR